MAKSKHSADDVESNSVSTSRSKSKSKTASKPSVQPAPFLALFRFASPGDILILSLGIFFCILMSCTLPGINIVFGDLINSIASPVSVRDVVSTALKGMLVLSAFGFTTFFLGFWLCGWAAARIANGFRSRFLEAVLRQDATFFDHAEGGSLSLMLSDAAFDIQNGLADKFAAMLQGFFQFGIGFAVAFYYGPLLSLVLLACVPVLGGIMTLLILWGSEDGILGKEAYEVAGTIANETLGNIRTVFSLNIETVMSSRYDSRLEESERAAVSQARKVSILGSLIFSVMSVMYGIGFYYGAVLIADSTDNALEDHPAPYGFLNGTSPYDSSYSNFTNDQCNMYEPDSDAYAVCACSLPWDIIGFGRNPNCGCGYDNGDVVARFSTNDGCFSGGSTLLVFFSILIGAFSAGQIGPGVRCINEARIAVAKVIRIIDRRPDIDVTKTDGKVRLTTGSVKGEIQFEDMHFQYQPKDADIAAITSMPKDKDKDKEKGVESSDEETEHQTAPRPVFGGCDLTIPAGTSVALVGESGCGKSTIAKLVQRFYDPTAGRITLDGVDLRDLAVSDLRANIGVVNQDR